MTPDRYLLCDYVENGSQAAFTELVERHQQLVYSICKSEVGDACLAEDVTQVVFLLLALKAPSLKHHSALAGWLFQTARFASRNARRKEIRRMRAEQRVVTQNAEQEREVELSISAQTEDVRSIKPLLNRALNSLNSTEREAVLLRFFEGRSVQETGAAMGVSNGAAQMRISRAVDKLRRFFIRRGIAISTAALLGLLSTRTAHTIPLACQAGVRIIAGGTAAGKQCGGAGAMSSMTRGVLRAMWTGKMQIALLLASVILLPFASRLWLAMNGAMAAENSTHLKLAVQAAGRSEPDYGIQMPQASVMARRLSVSEPVTPISTRFEALKPARFEPQTIIHTTDHTTDHSLSDDPELRKIVTIRAEGIAVGELFALLQKQTGVHIAASDYVSDDKLILYGPARPLNEIMADIAALFNDSWLHSRDGDRNSYLLTRQGPARYDEDKFADMMNRNLLAQIEEQVQALNETPEQLSKRPETDPIRQALSVKQNRITTSILGLLSPKQRQQLIEQWRVALPVAALNASQKDSIEDMFNGERMRELNDNPLVNSGAALPNPEIPRDQMENLALAFQVLNYSGSNGQGAEMSIQMSAPTGLSNPALTFSTRARFLLPQHGNPYSGQKVPAKLTLPDAKAAASVMPGGAWPDRLKAFAERAGTPVVADFYRSKPVFVAGDDDDIDPRPNVAALDDLCRPQGYLWWNRGKTLLFRKRDWYNQRQYEVPDRWVLSLSRNLQASKGMPTVADVLTLLDLSTNQIAGLSESLGMGSDRRQLIGLREILTAVAAVPSDKNTSIHSGPLSSPTVNNYRVASILPDLRDRQQRVLLNAFAQVFDGSLFTNPDLDEFGVIIQSEADNTGLDARVEAAKFSIMFYTDYKHQPGLRFGYILALPKSLPDDRRDRTRVEVQ